MFVKEMIGSIAEQYDAIGIKYVLGNLADITVDQELFDSKFATGKVKVHYENSILFSEKDKTIYYWEQTKEVKSGFSFGFSGESYVQSGSTLSRKVKVVQYSADGKIFEFDIDLGKINQIVKTAAKENNWKFKVVFSKKKASYHNG